MSGENNETFIIYGLLNLDAFKLVNLPLDQCMQIFLLCIKKLHKDIIFLSSVKLNKEGFCWAPTNCSKKVQRLG
jgi:hypothetical protein